MESNDLPRRAYTPEEVAELYGVARGTVYGWLERGDLVGMKISDGPRAKWRVSVAALDAFDRGRIRSRWSAPTPGRTAFDCDHPAADEFEVACPVCGALRTDETAVS